MRADLNAASPESLTALAIKQFPSGTLVDGRFEIRGVLGQGGMGLVLRAWDHEWERDCVLKMLAPHMHARFRPEHDCAEMLVREAKTLAKLANIHSSAFVQVYGRGFVRVDLGDDGPMELPYYAMELLRGSTFQRLILNRKTAKEREFFAWKHVINAAHKLSAALSVAHSLGFVHRDLKPDNIFLHSLGHGHEVKIIDWGISTKEGQPRRAGTGTVKYAAPELLRKNGYRYESTQSDIYPLGLFIFELATLRGPFEVGKEALAYAHVYEQPPELSEFRSDAPPALVQLVSAMLQKSPEKRPTAEAATVVLSELLFATLDGAEDAQIGDLLRGGRNAGAAASYVVHRPSVETYQPSNPVELLTSEPIVERRSPEPLRDAAATQPVATRKKYPDTVPDAEPFGATVGAAITAPLAPANSDGPLRIFHSTAEIFQAVWDDDNQYASSPLDAMYQEDAAKLPDNPVHASALPLNESTPGPLVQRTSASGEHLSGPRVRARRIAVGSLLLSGALLTFGVAARVARVREARPHEPAAMLGAAPSISDVVVATEPPPPLADASNEAVSSPLGAAVPISPRASRSPRTLDRAPVPPPPAPRTSSSDFADPWAREALPAPRREGTRASASESSEKESPDASSLGDLNLEITH